MAYRKVMRGLLLIPGGQVHGSLGQRTGLGMFLALCTPLAMTAIPPYGWLLAGWYGVGILLTRSAVASLAAAAGLLWILPHAWIVIVPVMIGGLAIRSFKIAFGTEGFSDQTWLGVATKPTNRQQRRRVHLKLRHVLESLEARKRVWQIAWQRGKEWPAWLVGHGPGAFGEHGKRWTGLLGGRFADLYQECHNDYLEFWYEHGIVGLAAVGYFLWRISDRFAVGDPSTGVLVALSVAMLANFPLKVAPTVAVVWLVVIGWVR